MTRFLIATVGATASGLIKLIGISWELRALTAIPVFSLLIYATAVTYAVIDSPGTPTVSISLTNGEEHHTAHTLSIRAVSSLDTRIGAPNTQ